MRHLLATLVCSASCAFYASGCGCTEVGCGPNIGVTVSDILSTHAAELPFSIHICLDGGSCGDLVVTDGASCGEAKNTACSMLDDGNVTFEYLATIEDEDSHTLSITVKGKDGGVILDEQKQVTAFVSEPNGSFCGPTCYSVSAAF